MADWAVPAGILAMIVQQWLIRREAKRVKDAADLVARHAADIAAATAKGRRERTYSESEVDEALKDIHR